MGIKNLLKFLNNLIVEKNINQYSGKKIAIDISILLYQVVISVRNSGADLMNKQGKITSHILGLFNKTTKLLMKGVIPVYVFDGKPPEIKRRILDMRKNVRKKAEEKMANAVSKEEKIKYFKRSVIITKEQLNDCRSLLNCMGVPYIDAPEEADSQCAWLAKTGLVDAVLTEDMDILTFGSPYVIRNLTSFKKKPIEISLEDIKTKFDWSQQQFIEFCILLGCDYTDHITDHNCNEIFKIYQKNKNIDVSLKEMKKKINYLESIEYFKHPKINNEIKEINMGSPRLSDLNDLLVNEYGLIKYKIQNKLNHLIIAYSKLKCIDIKMTFTQKYRYTTI
jgi:flap endonuclease-1